MSPSLLSSIAPGDLPSLIVPSRPGREKICKYNPTMALPSRLTRLSARYKVARPLIDTPHRAARMKISLEWLSQYLPGAARPASSRRRPDQRRVAGRSHRAARGRHRPRRRGHQQPRRLPVARRRGAGAGGAAGPGVSATSTPKAAEAAPAGGDASTSVAIEAPRPLPALHRPGHPQREDRPQPGLDGPPARSGRAAADQQRRRRHELRHVRARPAAARVRLRQARRPADRRPPGGGRARSSSASTATSGELDAGHARHRRRRAARSRWPA